MILTSVKLDNGKIEFFDDNGVDYKSGDKVVVGGKIGVVVSPKVEMDDDKEVEVSKIDKKATDNDIKKIKEREIKQKEIIKISNDLKDKHGLDMKFVDAEIQPDGTKVIITFVCEDRVDFRELVKDLANELKMRIELKQIGIRDQAKILGAIGMCGQECCCKRYINEFDKVSIKMAKTQGLSLNPTKISGVCGRLMCCLAYENEHYTELNAIVPKINTVVITPDGEGTVVYNELLKKKVTVKIVQGDNIKVNEYDVADIKIKNVDRKEEKKDSQKKDK